MTIYGHRRIYAAARRVSLSLVSLSKLVIPRNRCLPLRILDAEATSRTRLDHPRAIACATSGIRPSRPRRDVFPTAIVCSEARRCSAWRLEGGISCPSPEHEGMCIGLVCRIFKADGRPRPAYSGSWTLRLGHAILWTSGYRPHGLRAVVASIVSGFGQRQPERRRSCGHIP